HAGDHERPRLEGGGTAAEVALAGARRRAPRVDLHADDLVPAQRIADRERAEDRAAGVDDVEAEPYAQAVHELARGRVRLRGDDEVHGPTQVGEEARADVPAAEVSSR